MRDLLRPLAERQGGVADARVATAPLQRSPVPAGLLDHAHTLTEAFETLAARFPDYECLITLSGHGSENRMSAGLLWSRARSVGGLLRERGVGRGDVVIVILPTGRELVAAYFGVMLAGAVPALVATPANRLAEAEVYVRRVAAILANAEAAALITEVNVAATFLAHGSTLGRAAVLTTDDLAASPPPSLDYSARPDDIASIQYSSGSTGIPKGVLLTHRAMLSNLRAVRDSLRVSAADVSVNWTPLYHDMGLIGAFLLPLLCGCPTVLIPTLDFLRHPALWLRAIQHYRGTISWAPNFAYAICTKRITDEQLAGLDLSSWRIAINAAEPVLDHTIDEFTRRFAPHGFAPEAMTPAWGLAENVIMATAAPVETRPRIELISRHRLATEGVAHLATRAADRLPVVAVGRCLPGCALEIRDEAGRPLPDRHVGEIWLRSDSLFAGYNRDRPHTDAVLIQGWLDTGDRGYLAEGDLFFIAREKDLIVFAGEKYAPHDVEVAVNRVPGVREGCVVAFGILNAERGTEDLAVVVETRETDPEARDHLRATIRAEVHRATGLGVRHIVLTPPGGVEKTSSGKLARQATRNRYADQLLG